VLVYGTKQREILLHWPASSGRFPIGKVMPI